MLQHSMSLSLILLFPLLLLLIIYKLSSSSPPKSTKNGTNFPKSYPIIGHMIDFYNNKGDVATFQWLYNLTVSSPNSTFVLHRPFGARNVFTADPAIVEHILKTQFHAYPKGSFQKEHLEDLIGDGIFSADDETWKFQRQVASHEFNTKSLRKFVENVVDAELYERLVPILSQAAEENRVLDLQDILQRFTFDNICKISFGYDPEYLSPSLPEAKFAVAFEEAVMITADRFRNFFPILWKIKKFLNIGSEKKLKNAVFEIREYANSLVRRKKEEMVSDQTSDESMDLLSRFLKSGHSDEKFVTDIVISFILAGRDTTSSALTWFFWLMHNNPKAEEEVLKEVKQRNVKTENSHSSVYEQVKELTYTHAAICESMRLYPPVPVDTKAAKADDVLPGGLKVKKGTRVSYHPYAMGRIEKIWGPNWPEYRPERWLETVAGEGEEKWRFVARDPYSYSVFQAGPRICLGKEMALLQMKRVVAGVLERFKVVPVFEEGFEPVFVPNLTAKMQGGLPVRIEKRTL